MADQDICERVRKGLGPDSRFLEILTILEEAPLETFLLTKAVKVNLGFSSPEQELKEDRVIWLTDKVKSIFNRYLSTNTNSIPYPTLEKKQQEKEFFAALLTRKHVAKFALVLPLKKAKNEVLLFAVLLHLQLNILPQTGVKYDYSQQINAYVPKWKIYYQNKGYLSAVSGR